MGRFIDSIRMYIFFSDWHKCGHVWHTRRSPQTTRSQRQEGNLVSSWMTTRTGRTQPTFPGRVCSLSMMSEDMLRRRRGTEEHHVYSFCDWKAIYQVIQLNLITRESAAWWNTHGLSFPAFEFESHLSLFNLTSFQVTTECLKSIIRMYPYLHGICLLFVSQTQRSKQKVVEG